MTEDLRKKLVERATSVIIKPLEEFDVVFVIPPGSSRIEAVSKAYEILSRQGTPVGVIMYREPGGVAEHGIVDLEIEVAEAIKNNTKRKLIVVPRDTTTAISIAKNLKKKGHVDSKRWCFLNIAEVYGKEIREVEEHLVLDYSHIRKELEDLEFKLVPGYGGI